MAKYEYRYLLESEDEKTDPKDWHYIYLHASNKTDAKHQIQRKVPNAKNITYIRKKGGLF